LDAAVRLVGATGLSGLTEPRTARSRILAQSKENEP
jgi:hypothetical protein